jgi:hypothetical protein
MENLIPINVPSVTVRHSFDLSLERDIRRTMDARRAAKVINEFKIFTGAASPPVGSSIACELRTQLGVA